MREQTFNLLRNARTRVLNLEIVTHSPLSQERNFVRLIIQGALQHVLLNIFVLCLYYSLVVILSHFTGVILCLQKAVTPNIFNQKYLGPKL